MTDEQRFRYAQHLVEKHNELFKTYFADLDIDEQELIIERMLIIEEQMYELSYGSCNND